LDEQVVRAALDIFYHLRRLGLERAPTTREILSWLKYVKDQAPAEAVSKIKGLEGIGVLIKTQADMEKIQRMLGNNSIGNISYN
ncbi:MAG: MoxR family ATPase, partial [Bacteroidota bacterium]